MYFLLLLLSLSFFVVYFFFLLCGTWYIKHLINFDLIFIHYLPCRCIGVQWILIVFLDSYRFIVRLPFLPYITTRLARLWSGVSCGLKDLPCRSLLCDASLILLSESLKLRTYFIAQCLLFLFENYFTDSAFHVPFQLSLLQDGAANLTISCFWTAIGNVLLKLIIHLSDHELAVLAHLRLHYTVIMVLFHHKPLAIKVLAIFAWNLEITKNESLNTRLLTMSCNSNSCYSILHLGITSWHFPHFTVFLRQVDSWRRSLGTSIDFLQFEQAFSSTFSALRISEVDINLFNKIKIKFTDEKKRAYLVL